MMIVCAECESWIPEEGRCKRGIRGSAPAFSCPLGRVRRRAERKRIEAEPEGQRALFPRMRRPL